MTATASISGLSSEEFASTALPRIPIPASRAPNPDPLLPHPALELVVGSGVRDAMAAAGDEPRGHEEYVHDQETGAVLYSLTHGRDALYRWTPADGVKRLPLQAVAPPASGGAGGNTAPSSAGRSAVAPPELVWRPSPNCWRGRPTAPTVLVCHITDGGDPSAWFANPASQVSAYFSVLRDGRILQHVHVADRAWVNGVVTAARLPLWCPPGVNPNDYSVGVEHEGRPGDDVGEGFGCLSGAQFAATVALQRWLRESVPALVHWTGHSLFDPRSRAYCPGPSFPWNALSEALGLGRALPDCS